MLDEWAIMFNKLPESRHVSITILKAKKAEALTIPVQ